MALSEHKIAAVSELRANEVILPVVHSYAEFTERYATAYDTQTNTHLLLNRALHVAETSDRTTQVAVRQSRTARRYPAVRQPHAPEPYIEFPYDGHDFLVVSYDGHETQFWDTVSSYARYYARLNGVDAPYAPIHEIVHLELKNSATNQPSRLRFNSETGCGTLDMPSGYLGWILSAEQSDEVHSNRLLLANSTPIAS